MFSEEKLFLAVQKKQQSIGIKSFYSNTPSGFGYKGNYVRKLSNKMFIKRKTRAGKPYDCPMLPSFKTSVTYKKKF